MACSSCKFCCSKPLWALVEVVDGHEIYNFAYYLLVHLSSNIWRKSWSNSASPNSFFPPEASTHARHHQHATSSIVVCCRTACRGRPATASLCMTPWSLCTDACRTTSRCHVSRSHTPTTRAALRHWAAAHRTLSCACRAHVVAMPTCWHARTISPPEPPRKALPCSSSREALRCRPPLLPPWRAPHSKPQATVWAR
jgi:hypothetical protein